MIRYKTKVSEAFINLRQNMARDFNKLHCCFIREQRLFKHHNNHRQIVKRCFTDNIIKFRDWNSNLKFYKKWYFISWNTFSNCIRLKQSIYQWVLNKILQNFQHSTLIIHHISFSDWQIHWKDEQCYQINVESFQQLKSDKLSFFTADNTINNKKSCCLCNRNLIIFFTS